jgi:formate dehydrogenase accessory protein FdhD
MIRLGKSVAIEKINAVNREILKDTIPVELVLTIILNNRPVASISCLPDNLIELAIGYLLNNGYVKKYSDIILLRLCEKELNLKKIPSQAIWVDARSGIEHKQENIAGRVSESEPGIETKCDNKHESDSQTWGDIKREPVIETGHKSEIRYDSKREPDSEIAHGIETGHSDDPGFKLNRERIKYIPSGCGSFDEIILQKEQEIGRVKSKSKVSSSTILKLNLKNLKNQKIKKEFGGLHSSALFDYDCNCLCIMEDIGRHNCIDKLAGYIATHNIDPYGKIIFTTGRLSIDIIFKIYMMSVAVIVSNSSITHSAVLLAKRVGITSIGYLRGGRFNIYSNPSRIET